MADKFIGKRKFTNIGGRAYQLKPRVAGQTHFEFNPDDTITAASAEEETYLADLLDVKEVVEKKAEAEESKKKG